MTLPQAIHRRATEVGFELVGIAPATPGRDLEFAREWVDRGYAGQMRYLANPKRFDPRAVLPSVKSVICVGLIYNTPFPYSTEVGSWQKAAGRDQDSDARRQRPDVTTQLSVDGRNGPLAADNGHVPASNCELRVSPSAATGGQDARAPREREAALCAPQPSRSGRGWTGEAGTGEGEGPRAWISRYAWGRDYHEIMREKLERLRTAIEDLAPGVETRVYVDTGPVIERAFARYSGLGWMGKNTCIINEEKGSWFFLGVILTNLALEPDLPAPDRCGTCRACLDACPTGALVEPYVMDASRCISYLTIELKGSIPRELCPGVGVNVFGCDICQDVCPWNGRSQESGFSSQEMASQPMAITQQGAARDEGQRTKDDSQRSAVSGRQLAASPGYSAHGAVSSIQNPKSQVQNPPSTQPPEPCTFSLFSPPLEALAAMTEDEFRKTFAHSPIKRARYRGWLRNLCVAMGNSGDARFVPKLQELSQHPDPIVREHAGWALDRLRQG